MDPISPHIVLRAPPNTVSPIPTVVAPDGLCDAVIAPLIGSHHLMHANVDSESDASMMDACLRWCRPGGGVFVFQASEEGIYSLKGHLAGHLADYASARAGSTGSMLSPPSRGDPASSLPYSASASDLSHHYLHRYAPSDIEHSLLRCRHGATAGAAQSPEDHHSSADGHGKFKFSPTAPAPPLISSVAAVPPSPLEQVAEELILAAIDLTHVFDHRKDGVGFGAEGPLTPLVTAADAAPGAGSYLSQLLGIDSLDSVFSATPSVLQETLSVIKGMSIAYCGPAEGQSVAPCIVSAPISVIRTIVPPARVGLDATAASAASSAAGNGQVSPPSPSGTAGRWHVAFPPMDVLEYPGDWLSRDDTGSMRISLQKASSAASAMVPASASPSQPPTTGKLSARRNSWKDLTAGFAALTTRRSSFPSLTSPASGNTRTGRQADAAAHPASPPLSPSSSAVPSSPATAAQSSVIRFDPWYPCGDSPSAAFTNRGAIQWQRQRLQWTYKPPGYTAPEPPSLPDDTDMYDELIDGLCEETKEYPLPAPMRLADVIDLYQDLWEDSPGQEDW